MFAKGSRYGDAVGFRADKAAEVFAGVRPRRIVPAAGVLEHTLRAGDRLDLLALHYYDDPHKWWRILDANPDFLHAGDLAAEDLEGTVILIPAAEEPGGEA